MEKICKLIEMTQKEQISFLPTVQHGQMLGIFKILSLFQKNVEWYWKKTRRETDWLHANTSGYLEQTVAGIAITRGCN